MNFSNIKSMSWVRKVTNWLPFLQWISWVFVTFVLAKVFWLWLMYFTTPTEFKPIKISPLTTSSASSSTADINKLIGFNLFGSIAVNKPIKTIEVEAPVTQLNLKLRGIYSSQEKSKANAIIEDGRGMQAVYFLDEKLSVSGNVFLRQVMVDKVILETNGKREALRLDVDKIASISVRENTIGLIQEGEGSEEEESLINDKRNDQGISQQLNDYKNKLMDDPKSVADVIAGRPHFVEGELKGFSISPGRDQKLFKELGLQNGDLVTSINGISLTNMNDAKALMNDAQSIQELNIVIERDGESINLLLNLNDKVGM